MKLITEQNRKWWILIAMSSLLFMTSLDLTIVNLALPAMAHSLNINLAQLQWVITGYALTTVMFMILGGKLGDVYGHRKVFIIGAIIFVVASVAAGLSFTGWELIISRVVQGIGAAFSFPLTSVITFAAFPKRQKATALGVMATSMGVASAIGPTLGGVILKYLTWHWIFFINLPICVVVITLTLWACPKYILSPRKENIDYKGAVVLMLSLFLLLFGLNEAQNWGLDSVWFLMCLLAGLVLLLIFILFELKIANALIELKIFTNKVFALVNIIRAVVIYVFLVILFVFALYLQNIVGLSAFAAGFLLIFMTLAFAISSPLSGKVIDLIGGYFPILIALVLLVITLSLFITVTELTPIYMVAGLLTLCGIAFGILVTGTNVVALNRVPEPQIGAASGAFYTVAIFGGVVGVAVSGTMMALLSKSYLIKQLLARHVSVSSAKMLLLIKTANGSHSINKISQNFMPTVAKELIPIAKHAFLYAFHWIMFICAILVFISIILMLFIKRRK